MTTPPPPPGKPTWAKKARKSPPIAPAPNPFVQPQQIPPSNPSLPVLFKKPVASAGRQFGEFTQGQVQRTAQELANRKSEGVRLFEPLSLQQEFLDSHAYIRLLLGGNRAGKTLTGAAQCARIVSNMDPRYPQKGTFVVVGKDFDTLGQGTMRVLMQPGAFTVIEDPSTGLLRATRPWDEYDKAHRSLWKPARPMLPERLVKKVSWENKAKGIPGLIEMHTGWRILVFSGESEPKAGYSADVAWLDEEIFNERWVREIRQRLRDRDGCLYWTATPENSTPALFELYTHYADALAKGGARDIEAWRLSSLDHPHHSSESQRKQLIAISAEDYKVKMLGEFRLGNQIIFPEWRWERVSTPYFPIPDSWTKYLALDPGVNPCTIVFLAVPPDDDSAANAKHKGHVYVYDELIVEQSSSEKLAEQLKAKISGQRFELFLIDRHGGRLTEAGSGENSEDQYRRAFAENNIRSRLQGSNFTAGCDLPDVRINAIRSWLRGENPKLRVFESCATLKIQMERYQYERNKHGLVTNKPVARNNHAIDCLGMLADYPVRHVVAKTTTRDSEIHKKLKEKAKRRKGGDGTTFGPSTQP